MIGIFHTKRSAARAARAVRARVRRSERSLRSFNEKMLRDIGLIRAEMTRGFDLERHTQW